MGKVWKMYVTDQGLYSFQNEELELCDMYKVLVFLRNYYKNRMTESQPGRKSFLFELTQLSKRRRAKDSEEPDFYAEDDSSYKIYIDGNPVSVSWCICDGVAITSEDENGSRTVAEIARLMNREKNWWNN